MKVGDISEGNPNWDVPREVSHDLPVVDKAWEVRVREIVREEIEIAVENCDIFIAFDEDEKIYQIYIFYPLYLNLITKICNAIPVKNRNNYPHNGML
jgi:hypothetical protein